MTTPPAISVVIPTYGRPGAAARLVSALATQRLPPGGWVDVIVVDDGSPTPVEIAAEPPGTIRVRVLRQTQQGPAAARNAGIAVAQGAMVAFVDDDCEPALPPEEMMSGMNSDSTTAFAISCS